MKNAAKVFLVIGMVAGFWMVLPLVFGIITFKRVNRAKCKADLGTKWCVLSLIFVNVIAGILLLCLRDEHFGPQPAAEVYAASSQPDVFAAAAQSANANPFATEAPAFCPQCGAKLSAGAAFCPGCGTKISG